MLTQTLSNAISGLKVNQQALAVISQNIANANNADYSRQVVTQESVSLGGEVGNGVRIKEISRVADDFISHTVVVRGSDVARTATIQDYYDQVQQFYGNPNSGNSIDAYMDKFFNSLNTLQNNPKDASVKFNAVASASSVADELSTLAGNIETQRFQADKAIATSVNNVNDYVKQLQTLNVAITGAKQNNSSVSSLLDQVQATLKKLSSEMDINYRFTEDGTVSVTTSNGYTLLSGSSRYELAYSPSSSAEDFESGKPLQPIELFPVDLSGHRSDTATTTVVTGGQSADITSSLKGGNMQGLIEMRDKLLPNMLDQLDNLAANLRDSINAVHNQGSAFPPLAKLTGDTLISPSSVTKWSGKVMIAALKTDGSAIASTYTSEAGKGMPPLTLDLSKLDDGSGAGKPSVQGIIDEINQYYGVPQPHVNIGPLSNITLAAKSDSLDGNSGTFNFNLDFSNYSTGDAKVVVTGVNVNNGAVVSVPATFPTSQYSAAAGTSSRGLDFTLDMSAGTASNYAVSVDVQVTDSEGHVTTDTITYNLSEATSDLANRRYPAASVSGTGDAEIEAPNSTNPVMIAKLVDANGNEIAKDPTTGDYLSSGYMVLEGQDGTRVAISELDSADVGINGNGSGSGYGFSHYFGLNNFFVGTGTKNAALNMAVRADIVATPSLISTGTLTRSHPDSPDGDYTYSLGESSTSVIQNMVNLNLQNHQFDGSGTLPPISVTFSGYAAQILGYVSSATADAKTNADQQQLIYDGFADRDKNLRGVNIDEEMANTIIFQNAYAANARVINVVNELFDDLLSVFH